MDLGVATRNDSNNAISIRISFPRTSSTMDLLRLFFQLTSRILVNIFHTFLRRRSLVINIITTLNENRFRHATGNNILNRLTRQPSNKLMMSKSTILNNTTNIKQDKNTTISRRNRCGVNRYTRRSSSTRNRRRTKETLLHNITLISIFQRRKVPSL